MAAHDLPEDGSDAHAVPEGVSDATVEALGAVSEALETVERLRGHLYSLHQLTGKADFGVEAAATKLRDAGHGDLTDRLERELIGCNLLAGR